MFFYKKKKKKNKNKGGGDAFFTSSRKGRKDMISNEQRRMINWQILSKRRLLVYAESEC